VWAHWSPTEFAGLEESTPGTLVFYGGVGIGLIVLALLNLQRSEFTSADLRLGLRGWAFTLIVLGALTVIHLLQGEIDPLSLSVVVTLSVLSIMTIWFQKRKKGATLLDGVTNTPPPRSALALMVMVFALAGAVGYILPRGAATSEPLTMISAVFTAYGLIWLPAVTIVLGAQAFSRQARAMRL
jgi:hypothetical protein